MLAVDTNVIVRYLTRDDAEQFARASVLIQNEDVYVCMTVLLETEWVLRRGYRFSRERVPAALAAFAGLPPSRSRARLRSLAASYPVSRSTVYRSIRARSCDTEVPRRAARMRASRRSSSGRDRVMFLFSDGL